MREPLAGKRIVVTRSRAQAAAFGERLAALGANPVLFPVIEFAPLPPEPVDAALAAIDDFDWLILTSGNAVRFFFDRVDAAEFEIVLPKIAVTGSATAAKLEARGITPDFIPDEFVGEALVAGLGDLSGQRVLLPRSRIGRPEIVEMLGEQGAVVDDIPLYDTVTAVPTPVALADLQQGGDAFTFTSPSSVRNFIKILRQYPDHFPAPLEFLSSAPTVCIGPVTAAELSEFGLQADLVASEYTIAGLIQALVRHFQEVNV